MTTLYLNIAHQRTTDQRNQPSPRATSSSNPWRTRDQYRTFSEQMTDVLRTTTSVFEGFTQKEGEKAQARLRTKINELNVMERIQCIRDIAETGKLPTTEPTTEQGTSHTESTTGPTTTALDEDVVADYDTSDKDDDDPDEDKPKPIPPSPPIDDTVELPELFPHSFVYRAVQDHRNCQYASGKAGTLVKGQWETIADNVADDTVQYIRQFEYKS